MFGISHTIPIISNYLQEVIDIGFGSIFFVQSHINRLFHLANLLIKFANNNMENIINTQYETG